MDMHLYLTLELYNLYVKYQWSPVNTNMLECLIILYQLKDFFFFFFFLNGA